ncbi:AAA family ATPase [Haematobacter genomosp. 1]|uniref:AAA family ATPase n=1 Tax=Haematobacter genomosp. 1 TaxID=366618 RepID=UPI001C528AD0|nr:AAA family ATPase [Haematobacter genomosp. 1]
MSPELILEIFQIIPSDRRRFAEHFDFIDKADRGDDGLFYPALLERMNANPGWCRSLESAFQRSGREKDRQRAPSSRAWRWLKGAVPDIAELDADPTLLEAGEMDEIVGKMAPTQRAVFELFIRFLKGDASPPPETTAAHRQEGDLPEWMVLREQMRETLDRLLEADVDVASDLLGLAEDLQAACAEHLREADTRQKERAQARRAAFFAPLGWLSDFPGGEDLLAQAKASYDIDAVEAAIGPVIVAEADWQIALSRRDEAVRVEDEIRADRDRSKAELRAAGKQAELMEEAENAARGLLEEAVRTALQELESTPAVVGADVGPSGDEDMPGPAEDAMAPEDQAASDTVAPQPVVAVVPEPATVPDTEIVAPAPQEDLPQAAGEIARLSAIFDEPAPAASEQNAQGDDEGADEEPAAVWTGRRSLDDLLADYLGNGETALAWHFADLADENGYHVAISPLLIRALAVGPAITGPYDPSTQAVGELLASAMSALDRAAGESALAGQRARGIALAALLRPALMARDTNARDLLANLSLAGQWSAYAGVVNSLTELRHDLQPSVAELRALAGVEKQRRLPQVVAEIQGWLPGARAAQHKHAPSNTVLHGILSAQGELGRFFEAASLDDLATVDAGVEFLLGLTGDKSVAADLVTTKEKELDRPRSDAIRGTALDWICRKLRDGAELLLRWRTARHEDGGVDSRHGEGLQRYISNLRKELEQVRGEPSSGGDLDAAVQICVDRAIEDLIAVLEGRAGVAAAGRISDVMNLPLLRLPGICQPFAPEDAAYAEERRIQRARLLEALSSPQDIAPDEVTALRRHFEERALLPAGQILARLERAGILAESDLVDLTQEKDEVLEAAVKDAKSSIKSLRHELEPLQSIDLSTSQEIQQWLDRLTVIEKVVSRASEGDPVLPMRDGIRARDIPADFPQLAAVLDVGRQLRDSVRDRIMRDQEGRLRALIERYQSEGVPELVAQAREVVSSLAERDLLTVEDIVIRLQNGQNLALSEDGKEDYFSIFYPDFVVALATEDTGGGKISPAIDKGARLGPLDFTALDEGERKRSGQLFENWRALKNAMSPNRGDLGQSLRNFMERLGFTSVVIERETILSSQLRTMRMRCDELTAQHWFLPPAFGSEARGSYPVFLASGNIDDEQVTRELAKVGRDAPCILLVFGTLTKARRENFALAMRRAKQTVLLIDEAQLLYLATGSSWMERLFTCAAPFGYLQPYTTSPGKIPPEMFFGREEEIAKIESTTADGCLVYGGRQLGKSALLHHVRKRFHQVDIGRHAYYLKIDEFGGQVQSADQIWTLIQRELTAGEVLSKSAESPDDIRDGILAWLDRGGERRILLLIDEADMFLASEARSGFPNLNRLKDIMEISARRFKTVFAGLHNVRRMARAPNSPLVHLGEPICIGPMNTTSASSVQARRLVTEPMRAAGFDYASPDLVHAVLTRVNYYPSLVQVFCKALLEGMSNQVRPRGQGPRWSLEKENLFESNEDINSQIRERFQWTLNLDPRYELIAKVLALYRLDNAEGDGNAMSPAFIFREVENFWPRGFEKLPTEDFSAFLDEMVDLGVLNRSGKGGYGLRGAQVAQMLGQREQLEQEILHIAEKEPRVDYDPSFYHRRARPDQSERRSPLSDNALQALFDTRVPGIRFVVAPPGIWGSDAATAIAELADGWRDGEGVLSGSLFTGGDDDLRRQVERSNGRRVLVIPAATKGAQKWVRWLATRELVSQQGTVLLVFVGSHEHIARARPAADQRVEIKMFRARPWERNMVRAWLAEGGLQALDTAECRDALLDVTGGSPLLLNGLRTQLETLVTERRGKATAEAIRTMGEKLGILPGEVGLPESLVPLFCTAVELLGQGEERGTLIDLLVEEGNAAADRDIRLMERLGLFRPAPDGSNLIRSSALAALVFRTCERPAAARVR